MTIIISIISIAANTHNAINISNQSSLSHLPVEFVVGAKEGTEVGDIVGNIGAVGAVGKPVGSIVGDIEGSIVGHMTTVTILLDIDTVPPNAKALAYIHCILFPTVIPEESITIKKK